MPAPTCHCVAYPFPHRAGSGGCACDHSKSTEWLQNLCGNCANPSGDEVYHGLSDCCTVPTLPNSAVSRARISHLWKHSSCKV